MGMENLLINNMFTGFTGSVNVNQCDEQSACMEGDSENFLSVLNNIMSAGCMEEGATGEGNAGVAQKSCMQDIYPLLLGLLQNISNVNAQKVKDAGVFSNDPSQQQSNGKDDSSDAGDNDTVEIDLTGMDAAYIQTVLLLLNSISETLSKGEIDLDIKKIIGENLSDDVFISVVNMAESVNEGKDSQFLFDRLTEIGQKGEAARPIPQQSPYKISTMPFIDGVYSNSEQSFNKEAQTEGADIPSSKERVSAGYFIYDVLPGENNLRSMSSTDTQQKPRNDMDSDVRNNIEILVRNITDAVKQEKNSNKESFFTKDRQTDLDAGYPESKEDGIHALFSKMEKQFDESIITRKKDVMDLQNKDLKLLSNDNKDYLSFSKQDNFENTLVQEVQSNKTVKEAPFTSVMTDKIEKIVEQYLTKGPSMDMIVRLKINDNDTLLVGLKNNGQKIMVDVKTTDAGTINILQAHKDDIIRNLEEKNVYTNIFVDPDGAGNFERREAKRENQKNYKETAKQKDFIEFLETSVQGGV
jgi:hypothetical protein